jgi:hypothetical protein
LKTLGLSRDLVPNSSRIQYIDFTIVTGDVICLPNLSSISIVDDTKPTARKCYSDRCATNSSSTSRASNPMTPSFGHNIPRIYTLTVGEMERRKVRESSPYAAARKKPKVFRVL